MGSPAGSTRPQNRTSTSTRPPSNFIRSTLYSTLQLNPALTLQLNPFITSHRRFLVDRVLEHPDIFTNTSRRLNHSDVSHSPLTTTILQPANIPDPGHEPMFCVQHENMSLDHCRSWPVLIPCIWIHELNTLHFNPPVNNVCIRVIVSSLSCPIFQSFKFQPGTGGNVSKSSGCC